MTSPSGDPSGGVHRASVDALLAKARAAGDRGRPYLAVRLARQAMRTLESTVPDDVVLRTRILINLSFNTSELGDVRGALALLDTAHAHDRQAASLRAARALILHRSGDTRSAQEQMDQAIVALADGDQEDLASVLLNRGSLHMTLGNLRAAQADTVAAEAAARSAGADVVVFMARHNLGYIRFLAGDLPGALQSMAAAEELAPEAALGVPALDRARVLLAAGLIGEAREYVDSAIATFAANRAMTDLSEALLVAADLAVLANDPAGARVAARRAARISARRGDAAAALLTRVIVQRMIAVHRRASANQPAPRSRAFRARAAVDAAAAARLADELAEVGLHQDATAALILSAEAELDAGNVDVAADMLSRSESGGRNAPLATRLHAHLIAARVAIDRGNHPGAMIRLRRGLDELADFQARFGSQDLQSAAAVRGGLLAAAGLRAAVRNGSPAVILQWLERARATTTRLPHVRPPADPALAADLGALRVADAAARAATLAGRPDTAREREVVELRRRVRARSWTTSGSGTAIRPPSLAAVQRTLATRAPGGTVLAYFSGAGQLHCLVTTARGAAYHRLAAIAQVEALLARTAADLDLLAADRVPGVLRAVAERSLSDALAHLSAALVEPVLADGPDADGPVLLSAVGALAAAPWALLPSLAGRAVSASTSVTATLSGLSPHPAAHRAGVLAVAGPSVARGPEEVRAVAARYPGATALTGSAATGRAVLDAMPAGGLLHIAAHGHHEPDSPLFSSVRLDDGPLYAYDIAPNPALPSQVVLSSCDVGRSVVRADAEPLGLAVALLRSGVRTVIAAVAQVSDHAATDVMSAYHDRIAAGDGPAAALAAALPAAGGRPAPFTCFGAGA